MLSLQPEIPVAGLKFSLISHSIGSEGRWFCGLKAVSEAVPDATACQGTTAGSIGCRKDHLRAAHRRGGGDECLALTMPNIAAIKEVSLVYSISRRLMGEDLLNQGGAGRWTRQEDPLVESVDSQLLPLTRREAMLSPRERVSRFCEQKR